MKIPDNKKIILFDGVCNLCNSTVLSVIKRDKKDSFRFASLQSDIGMQLTKERGIDTQKIDSIILIDPGSAYFVKSTAALEIAKEFGGFMGFMGSVLLFIPGSVRDMVYNFIAKNRYRWYGKKEQCMVPTPELRDKFL
ncbi:Predicted thiol-disulfide oxidoreductase YuxK, DCC family [Zhouia amylolytica]|uniref:Predicted thiol-disulfide oxidoreductase YuxK, DCC family n=1 Tax=Zhouia amylolytica TaxID=376730 RepID=A0A1I6UKS6_9FLAO|nr:DCC1-like thiol-disulfide oxidoreductase family protein [Zhouia amylolytica]SFT02008.1 Predicted thiol-disulfide oxidoreductase YuxK, DCC family [Zhouia amylolytica]